MTCLKHHSQLCCPGATNSLERLLSSNMVSHVSPWRLFWPVVTKLVIGFSISVWLASGEEQCGQEGQGFIQLQRHTHKYNYTSDANLWMKHVLAVLDNGEALLRTISLVLDFL